MPTTYRIPGLVLTEHELELPLDHATPGEKITVFAREVAADDDKQRPYLVYFQGGPGNEASRYPRASGWLERALEDYTVLLLDQRGTGRSTPVGALPGLSPEEQADYLKHLRADSIVRDAEAFREHLGVDRWSIIGQSFGGFCCTTYLSIAPQGLREAFITGGTPPLRRQTDEVYTHTYERVRDRNVRYYARYPEDRDRVRRLFEQAESGDLRFPSGDPVTVRRLRQLGSMLGMIDGAERLHYILERPPTSPAFLHDAEAGTSFARNPLYAIIHEACYADACSTRWAAERVMPDDFRSTPELFTGEHVYPWMFEDYGALAPLREAAELIANHEWPALYDPDQLAHNEVPTAAAIYVNDMYVERKFSEETAAHTRNFHPWITNEYEHDGLGKDGKRVLGRLIDLVKGRD